MSKSRPIVFPSHQNEQNTENTGRIELSIVLSEERIAVDDDNVCTGPIIADRDILDFVESSKCIIDTDSHNENEMNNTASFCSHVIRNEEHYGNDETALLIIHSTTGPEPPDTYAVSINGPGVDVLDKVLVSLINPPSKREGGGRGRRSDRVEERSRQPGLMSHVECTRFHVRGSLERSHERRVVIRREGSH
ncbi:hypothetical protein TNCV_2446591 [Trichonephila clavipes]|nr:hypothetical protein TNCV_2446591 [Trichonephila clavipes]